MKRVYFALACMLAWPLLDVSTANAQDNSGGGGAAPAGGGGPAGGGAPAGGATAPTGMTAFGPVIQPTPSGQVLGGGNVQGSSSSQPHAGDKEDGFDLGQSVNSTASVHGNENGSFIMNGGGAARVTDASTHTVRRGDTLWGICDSYFKNPYQWPRIWSFNPQIQNPHWIYPGDVVRLKSGVTAPTGREPEVPGQNLVDRRRQVGPETIFLRTDGFVDDDQRSSWGVITGSREDKMFLDDFDEVYLRIADGREVKLGQELTVFRPNRSVGGVQLVQIQGTIRIDEWNAQEHIARGRIVETLDVIERGAMVGPVIRKYEIVPPKRNDVDLTASIATSVHAHVFYGQNQVVFIEKGDLDGLKAGNRLFVFRKGDAWHQTLPTRQSAQRISIESSDPAAMEVVPRPRDESILPEEVIAEIRVVNTRQHSAMCLVTNSTREIEIGDEAVSRKGY